VLLYAGHLTNIAAISLTICLLTLTGMDGDVVARNIREFEQTHEDVDVGQGGVWIVG